MRLCADVLHQLLQLDFIDAGWSGDKNYPKSTDDFAMTMLSDSLLKKFHNDERSSARDKAAIDLFKEANQRCGNFTSVVPERLHDEYILGEMKSIIYDFFFPCNTDDRQPLLLNLSDISSRFCLGNGSNIGASSTDLYTKVVNSRMSSTNHALPMLYRHAISCYRTWADIEVFRSERFGTDIVTGSRLSCVPKSRKISRTICTEPVLNMLFQRGIGVLLEERLKEIMNIDLSTQPQRNSELARIGSITGEFGTIDLSSASDSISLTLVKWLLPPEPFRWLMQTRSPTTTLPDGEVLELHMISSMGNGYTFPLQTLIFAALVKAVYRIMGIKAHKQATGPLTDNFAVFGDDIIVRREAYNTVVRILEILGFRVNLEKSFNEGFFRESCGSDYLCGHNVRGVYVSRLKHQGDIYSAINRLNLWSSKHGVFISRAISYLRSGVPFNGVPFDEADDAGIKVPYALLRTPRRDINGAIKYVAHVNTVRRVRIPSVHADTSLSVKEIQSVRKFLPDFAYSPDGLMMCLLAGWLRDGTLGLRSIEPRTVKRRRLCPGWDESVCRAGESLPFSEKWKFFTTANLVN